mmetsp:Transcript_11906/g.21548  ORF Transcript_11906/g.21548 Transcript_11906/m.21548 type:complete len:85 (+) Transcript_11906:47-301(+)
MGKRKKSTKPPPKAKKPALEKVFDCPFCGRERCVDCDMERARGLGRVSCRFCKAAYSKKIHHLEEPIDVYSEWIDRTVEVNKED